MIPIFQTVVDQIHGNCFSACVASLLEMSLEEVEFHYRPLEDEKYWQKFWAFLNSKGYDYYGCKYGTDVLNYAGLNGYSIVSGDSRTFKDTKHVVIFKDGKMVHDPNPSGKGLQSINYCYMIELIRGE